MNWLQSLLKTYRKGKQYDDLQRRFNELQKEKKSLQSTHKKKVNSLKTRLQKCEDALSSAKQFIKQVRSDNRVDLEKHKNYYMYPSEQDTITYNMRRRGRVDVREAFRVEDEEQLCGFTQDLIEKGGLSSKNSPLQIVDKLYKLFVYEVSWNYVTDDELYGRIEYWQEASKSSELLRGDCDDLSILMHMTIRKALQLLGYESEVWRLRFVAGRTLTEGHAYNIWLHYDGEWYVIESTLDEKESFEKTWLKTPLRKNNLYGNIYFFTTPEQSWKGDEDIVEPYKDKGR